MPDAIKHLFSLGFSVDQANLNFNAAMELDRASVWRIFKIYCKNCWIAGRGWFQHKLSDCRTINRVRLCHGLP